MKHPDTRNGRGNGRTLLGSILSLAVPVMLSNLLETLYNLTDSFFLGRLGRTALAAPAVSNSVIYLITVAGLAFSTSSLTLIAQAKGRNDPGRAEHYLGQAVLYSGLTGIVLSVVSLFALDGILTALGVPPDARASVRDYMGILFAGLPFLFLTFTFKAAMQGWGDSLTPLLIQGGAILLNAILDPLFIFGPGPFPALGVRGAAYTTVFSQALTAAVGYGLLIAGRSGFRLRFRHLRPDSGVLLQMLKVGVPVSIGQGLTAAGFTVLSRLMNSFGSAVVAAAGIGDRIINLFVVPVFGLSTATASITGRFIGARKYGRARKTVGLALAAGAVVIGIGMTFTFFAGAGIMVLFTRDPDVIAYGKEFFRYLSFPVVLLALSTVVHGAFEGAAYTVPVMALSIVRLWGIRVPASYLLALTVFRSPLGIWVGSALSNIGIAAATYVLWKRGTWLRGAARRGIAGRTDPGGGGAEAERSGEESDGR